MPLLRRPKVFAQMSRLREIQTAFFSSSAGSLIVLRGDALGGSYADIRAPWRKPPISLAILLLELTCSF